MTELVGVAFPFRIRDGGVARATGRDKLRQNLRQLLSTRIGERVMLRRYGGGVQHRLQEPNDTTLRTLIRHDIEKSLQAFMPDVQLTAPIRIESTESRITVIIDYTIDPGAVIQRLELELN